MTNRTTRFTSQGNNESDDSALGMREVPLND